MFGMITRSAAAAAARARTFSSEALRVVNDVARKQFIVSMEGAEAALDYEADIRNKAITFTNTNVPEQFRGKGVGKVLAEYAFNYALERELEVECQCSFLAKYYNENKDKFKGLTVHMNIEE